MPRRLSITHQLQIYIHFRDSLLHLKETEERQSEQRIVFFFALATLVFGLLTFLARESSVSNSLDLVTIISLFVLFLFGLLTFARVIWRSRNVDRIEHVINNLNKAIEALDPQVRETLKPFDDSKFPIHPKIEPLKGTLAQFLYLSEFLLAGAFVYLVVRHLQCSVPWSLVLAFSIATPIVLGLFKWSQHVRGRSKKA